MIFLHIFCHTIAFYEILHMLISNYQWFTETNYTYVAYCKQAIACANGTNSSLCNRLATLINQKSKSWHVTNIIFTYVTV